MGAWMTQELLEEIAAEEGARMGDPRRCPRHPGVQTSSPDGMHDAPCGACENAQEADWYADAGGEG